MGIELVKPGGSLSFEKTKVRAVEEVYVGDSAPTEDKGYKVWVNPDGDEVAEIAELATKKYVDSAINSVDLSGYATKTYVDSAVSNIEIPEVDLSEYALKSEIPDTSAFRTEEEIIALIEAHGGSGEALPASEEVEF